MGYLVRGVNLCGVCKMEKHISSKLKKQRRWSPSLILSLREIGGVEITTLWGRHNLEQKKKTGMGRRGEKMPPHCSFGKIFTWLQSELRDKTYVILPASHKL